MMSAEPFPMSRKLHILPVAFLPFLLTVCTPSALAHDLEIEFLLGGDDNPNELSETFEADNAYFAQARIELSHMPVRTGFYYDFEARGTIFPSDEEAISDPAHADETRGSVALGYKWRPRFDYGRARFKFEFFGKSKDSTYVDRNTGEIAHFNRITPPIDEPVEDRFDYTVGGIYTSGNIPLSEDAYFIYDLEIFNKTYQDYPDFELEGLDNLDYNQVNLDFGFEKWIWPRTNLITMLGGGIREYVTRPTLDDDGAEIIGSVLGYTFMEIENAAEFDIGSRLKWKFGFDVEKRQDNNDGFYDMTDASVFTRIKFNNPGFVKIVLSASYSKRKFDNLEDFADADDNDFFGEEDLREKEGYRVKLEMIRNMYQWTRIPFDVIIGAKAKSFENSKPEFTYDRTQVYFGVRWRPFDVKG